MENNEIENLKLELEQLKIKQDILAKGETRQTRLQNEITNIWCTIVSE